MPRELLSSTVVNKVFDIGQNSVFRDLNYQYKRIWVGV